MSAETTKGKLETYEGGSVLPPGVHDALIHADDPPEREQEDFDPEWYLCQTSVTLVGKFYYKEELKIGDGPYGKYCSFSLRTKKLKNGTPRTCFFYVKVWGNDLIALLERLPNETFIKVTGDLETWRNSTYIRARTIMPMLNLDQHVEELKQKELMARMENDGESMEEIRIAREAIGAIAQRARSIVDSADGVGYAEQTAERHGSSTFRDDDMGDFLTPSPRAAEHPASTAKRPEHQREPVQPAKNYPEANSKDRKIHEERSEYQNRELRQPEKEQIIDKPSSEINEAKEKGDEAIMSAKEDLAYILDVLEDMEDFENEENDENDSSLDKKTADMDDMINRYKNRDARDEDDEDEDEEDEDEEDEEEIRVSVVDTERGKTRSVSETTLSAMEEERRARRMAEMEEERKRLRESAERMKQLDTGFKPRRGDAEHDDTLPRHSTAGGVPRERYVRPEENTPDEDSKSYNETNKEEGRSLSEKERDRRTNRVPGERRRSAFSGRRR